ncbi:VOC family protein [Polycladidibacter hongkongensis]|uniref:VOC family protein n=1 Tax=Polycladidibacter hongkongensis TaxID=1647556 RepID=UPI00082B8195|nr:VOC family protein [Pseudovibrio hongkongensis]
MRLVSLDHVVVNVSSLEKAGQFYRDVLGMLEVEHAKGRKAYHFGCQKVNLVEVEGQVRPNAKVAAHGAADLCFLVENIDEALAHMHGRGVSIEEGPVYRSGAASAIRSIYVRDPDGNLIELAQPENVMII